MLEDGPDSLERNIYLLLWPLGIVPSARAPIRPAKEPVPPAATAGE
jgi:hypothetical protein